MPTTAGSLARAVGFRTSDLATTTERAWETKKSQQEFKDDSNNIMEKYRYYLENPKRTPKELKEILDDITEYNKAVMDSGMVKTIPVIKRDSLKAVAKSVFKPSKSVLIDLERNK